MTAERQWVFPMDSKADVVMPDGKHRYWSTHCRHGNHADCKGSCKICASPCICSCPHPTPADGPGIAIPAPTGCCGDPKNLDGNAHPWEHVSEDGPGDVYRCPECGAVDID